MEKRSWFFQNGFFTTILVIVLLVHLLLLAVRWVRDQSVASSEGRNQSLNVPPRPPMKVSFKNSPKTRAALKRQIVQSQDPATLAKTKNSQFLSDKNRQFDKQTMARKVDKFNAGGKGDSTQDAKESKAAQAGHKSPQDVSLSDLSAFGQTHNPFSEGAAEYARQKKNQSVAGARTSSSGSGVSSTNDFVDHIPLGDMTYLNTTEYQYYGFYYRIRQKLEQFWGRSIQSKIQSLMAGGRKLPGSDHLITGLSVTMDERGEIRSIVVKGTSGIKELDDAAIESFNQAGPFPHPPRGLIENGVVKIEWGFVVQTSSR